uniref:Uncharacterized protein n=1 Tax=Cucumis sativus TaxID=3659 RepID=A0A0A0LJS0_CUCSA
MLEKLKPQKTLSGGRRIFSLLPSLNLTSSFFQKPKLLDSGFWIHSLSHCFNPKCYGYDEIRLRGCSSWPQEVLFPKASFFSNQSGTGTTHLRFWQVSLPISVTFFVFSF